MTLDLARIKAICFDVDGTLSDTDDQWVSGMEHYLKRFFPRGDVRSFARWAMMCAELPGNLVYQLLDRISLDDEVGWLYNFICRYSLHIKPTHFWLMQGMQEALRLLSQYYPLAVVSARSEAGTLAFLDQFQLRGYFCAVATAFTCKFTKPFPHPVLWAASQMQVEPRSCLMVGDTTVDIRAGKSAGAQTVGVLCGFGREKELRHAGADLILPHTAALVDILLADRLKPKVYGVAVDECPPAVR